MWVNRESDPSVISLTTWPGVSGRVLERSAITSMPFLSDMGVGNGKYRFVEGEKQAAKDWYHSGMQSILPTWRWWIENKGDLRVDIDWDNAYNVGSSFKFSGTLSAGEHLVRLYKTQIPVTAGGTLRVVYKTASNVTLEAQLSTESSTTPDVTLAATKTSEKNGWVIAEYNLSPLNGKTLYMVALNIKSDAEVSNFALNLGQIAILPAGYSPAAVAVSNLNTMSQLGEEGGDIRLTWDYDWTKEFDHFDIYTVTEGGARDLVGQTRDVGFYIPAIERGNNDAYVNVELVPVMKDGKQSAAQTLKVDFPAPQKPKVTFAVSPKSYVKVGDEITITAKGTGHPTEWQWKLPTGLKLAEGSSLTEPTIKVIAEVEGKQSISVDATNEAGTSTTTAEIVDVFASEVELSEVKNVVVHKTVISYSGSVNSEEVPEKIIDGETNPWSTSDKWCNISPDNEVVFDCEGAYRMYGFKIYDGNAGPESGVDQIDSYTIEVSQDMVSWTTVVDAKNREAESIKEDFIAPIKARYIRLRPHVNGTLRIWEFEAYGRDDNNMTLTVSPRELVLNAGETTNVVVSYAFNGDKRDDNFTCKATVKNENVTIGTIAEDESNGTFTIPVTAAKVIGEDEITITVNNGGSYKVRTVNVTIDSDDRPNVLKGAEATVRHYKADYTPEAEFDTYTVNTLTDGNTTAEGLEVIETPSTHTNDVWAIFEAPEKSWNLSKVKIYLPNNNRGTNDNDNEGNINNDISIFVGNDTDHLSEVRTFYSIGDVSELTYIFPQYKKVKYLAIACNLNAYFYASLAEVEAFEQYVENVPILEPVEVNGWNADVIAEAKPAADHTNSTIDAQGWVLYTKSLQEQGAIAGEDGLITTKQGTTFKLADVTGNNALVMSEPYENYVLTFGKPTSCEELRLLMLSTSVSYCYATINYADGTNGDETPLTVYDWYSESESSGDAIYGYSRIITKAVDGYQPDDIDSRFNFRMFEFTLPADMSKKVKSLTISPYGYMGHPALLAISMKARPVDDGIETTAVESGTRTIEGIYSINGTKQNALKNGINIIRYTDGTVRKVMIRNR